MPSLIDKDNKYYYAERPQPHNCKFGSSVFATSFIDAKQNIMFLNFAHKYI